MLRALFPQRCFAEWGCTADPSAYLEDVVVQCELKVRRLHARFGQQPWDNADQKRLYRVLLSTPTARLLTLPPRTERPLRVVGPSLQISHPRRQRNAHGA